jgi:hypothetical protein
MALERVAEEAAEAVVPAAEGSLEAWPYYKP